MQHRNIMPKVSNQSSGSSGRFTCSASLMQSHSRATSKAIPGRLAGLVGLYEASWRIIRSQEACRTVAYQCS